MIPFTLFLFHRQPLLHKHGHADDTTCLAMVRQLQTTSTMPSYGHAHAIDRGATKTFVGIFVGICDGQEMKAGLYQGLAVIVRYPTQEPNCYITRLKPLPKP